MALAFAKDGIDTDAVRSYLRNNDPYDETLSLKNASGRCVLYWNRNEEGGIDGWTNGEGILNRLISIREELLRGDYRALFLGWLSDFDVDDWTDSRDSSVLVPPIPAGLDCLTPSLQALMEQFPVDQDALNVAAGKDGGVQKQLAANPSTVKVVIARCTSKSCVFLGSLAVESRQTKASTT